MYNKGGWYNALVGWIASNAKDDYLYNHMDIALRTQKIKEDTYSINNT